MLQLRRTYHLHQKMWFPKVFPSNLQCKVSEVSVKLSLTLFWGTELNILLKRFEGFFRTLWQLFSSGLRIRSIDSYFFMEVLSYSHFLSLLGKVDWCHDVEFIFFHYIPPRALLSSSLIWFGSFSVLFSWYDMAYFTISRLPTLFWQHPVFQEKSTRS